MAAQTLNLCGVLSESKRIINAHSRHFLALSVLFLLPLCFSLIIYPTLQSTLSHHPNPTNTQILLRHLLSTAPAARTLVFPIIYVVFVVILSICAVATITYSTYHGFYGRPVKLGSAIKSILHSFLPLLSTTVAIQLVALLICLIFFFLLNIIVKGADFLGFQIENDSNCYTALLLVLGIALGLVLISLQVHWTLACVIVVAESKWGLEPLWRSSNLVRGMKSVSLSLLLFFGISVGFMIWASSTSMANVSYDFSEWSSWAFILQTVVCSSFLTLFMLNNAAANTVLYMYCKALHGELAFEIAEEFAREYVSLPFDGEKVPHVVTVVQV